MEHTSHNDDICPFRNGEPCRNDPLGSCPCDDCGVDTLGPFTTEIYLVTNEVWAKAGMSYEGILCIGCLERRLGRLLEARDFDTCGLNYGNVMGTRPATARLLHRMFSGRGRRNHFHEWVSGVHDDYTFGDKSHGDEQIGHLALYCECEGYPDHWQSFETLVRRSGGGRLRPPDFDFQVAHATNGIIDA